MTRRIFSIAFGQSRINVIENLEYHTCNTDGKLSLLVRAECIINITSQLAQTTQVIFHVKGIDVKLSQVWHNEIRIEVTELFSGEGTLTTNGSRNLTT